MNYVIRRLMEKIEIFFEGLFHGRPSFLIKMFSRLLGDLVQSPSNRKLPFNIWLLDSLGTE